MADWKLNKTVRLERSWNVKWQRNNLQVDCFCLIFYVRWEKICCADLNVDFTAQTTNVQFVECCYAVDWATHGVRLTNYEFYYNSFFYSLSTADHVKVLDVLCLEGDVSQWIYLHSSSRETSSWCALGETRRVHKFINTAASFLKQSN